jgi:high-affinity iron transporter
MLASAIVVFREVLEAALVLGIVLAASRGIVGSRAWIAAGVVAGVLGAICVAAAAEPIAAAFEGVGQELFNATVLTLAVVMLAWHAIWMRKHGAEIARELRDVGYALAAGDRHVRVRALIVGLAVLREGAEVVLFMYGLAAGGLEHGPLLAGAVLGLGAGVLAGALMYFGLLRIPARLLFSIT